MAAFRPAFRVAPRRPARLVLAGLVATSLLVSGCDALQKLLPRSVSSVITAAKPTSPEDVPPNNIADPHLQIQLLTVHVLGPSILGDGTRIVGERADGTTGDTTSTPAASAAPAASGAATAFGLLQSAQASQLPVQNGFVGVRGYDYKTIEQLPNRYTDEDGVQYFKYVPARIAFFLEVETQIKGKTYQELGLTRTPDEGLNSEVTVDVASTLVARELLRIWQMTDYFVSYKDLSPKDFNPLLAVLRAVLRDGLPADIPLDLTSVHAPDGKWSLDADKQDGALVFLSRLAQRQPQVSAEVDRLYQAVNYTMCNCRDDSKIYIKRPEPL